MRYEPYLSPMRFRAWLAASEAEIPSSERSTASLPPSRSPRSSRAPGMHMGHDLLYAVTVAIALLATLLLYSLR